MMRHTDSIAELAKALTTALGELSDVPKGREAKIPTKAGSNYSYRYADLGDALSMVRPVFQKHGLAVIQNASSPNDSTVLITTTIIHSSGQYLTFEPLALPSGRTAQETGSAITYGRRYHLLASLGLATDDDDGASAAPRQQKQTRSQEPRQTVQRQTKPASGDARSESESKIRELLAGLDASVASRVKRDFVTTFGALKDLEVERHDEALLYVEASIAALDAEDSEWIASARGDDE